MLRMVVVSILSDRGVVVVLNESVLVAINNHLFLMDDI